MVRSLVMLALLHITTATTTEVMKQQLPKSRCIFGLPGINDVDDFAKQFPKEMLYLQLIDMLRRMNCSLPELPIDIGSLEANGSYSGIAGMLQRDEIDLAFGVFRTDFFEDMVALPCTHGFHADVIILSRQNDSTKYNHSLGLKELWFSSYDRLVVAYLFFSLYIFTVVLLVTQTFNWMSIQQSIQSATSLKRLFHNIYQTLMSFIDRGSFEPVTTSENTIILWLNLFILFAVHGIVFGCIGAGLVSWIDPPVIESLMEFKSHTNPKPAIIERGWIRPVLDKAKAGDELFHLKRLIHEDPEASMIRNPSDAASVPSVILGAAEQIVTNQIAFIMPEYFISWAELAWCEVDPSLAKYMGRSKTLFAPGLLTFFMSKKIDPVLRVYWNSWFGSTMDAGLWQFMGQQIVSATLPSFTGHIYRGRKCNIRSGKDDSSAEAFPLSLFANLFIVCIVAFCVSLVVLWMEMRNRRIGRLRFKIRNAYYLLLLFIVSKARDATPGSHSVTRRIVLSLLHRFFIRE
jgi:hypothetical protein